jgi:WD40 repeat protein
MNVLCVSFSPDGSRLASASRDATVRIWSVKTGRCDILEGRLHGVKHVAFAPDGLFLASAAEDGSIKLWNLTTGTPYVTSLNDWGDVWSLAFSPDSKALTSVTTDANAIRVVTATVACSTPTENERRETALLNSPISAAASAVMSSAQLRLDQSTTIDAVALSLDGRLVAFSTPSKLRLCSVTSSNVIFDVDEVTIGDWCYALTISPDSKMLACGYILGKVVLYDIESGIEYGSRGGHYSPVTTVAFSPDGQFFASGSDDGTVCIWDVAPSTTRGSLDRSTARVNYLAYLPDRQTLAAFYRRGPVEVRDVRSGSRRTLGVDCGDWKDVAISPDSRRVAVSCSDWIELAEVASGATRRICNNYGHDATLAFSPDGKLLLSGSDRGLVRLHDSSTGAALNIIGEHLEYVTSVIFSPDGRLVAAASRDETVRCWDLVTGNALRHLKGHGGSVNSIAISPTSLYLVSGSRDETVKLWYLATSAECYTFKGHSAPVHRVAISPDGQLIASASVADVRLWSAAMREQIHVYPKHSGIRSLRFSTDPCCIETDQGAVALPFGYPTGSSAYSHAVGPLCVIDQWLMCDSKRLLWLPYEYRPTAVATCGNMISLGLNSGEVISLSFDFQNGRPWDSPDTDL